MTANDTERAIQAVFKIESARLIAGLARLVRDVGLAEDLAQDALLAALEHWPVHGVRTRLWERGMTDIGSRSCQDSASSASLL